MKIDVPNPNVPQWKLRRLAVRALYVLDEHGKAHPEIASFEAVLRPAAEGFLQVHVALAAQASRRGAPQVSRTARDQLARSMRAWLGVVQGMQRGFDAQPYLEDGGSADDVIVRAARLVQVLKVRRDEGNPLPSTELMIEKLEGLVASARAEHSGEQAGLRRKQELQSESREAGNALQALLVPFRRTVRAVLGSSHRDYQALRVSRSAHDNDDALPTAVPTSSASGVAQAADSEAPLLNGAAHAHETH